MGTFAPRLAAITFAALALTACTGETPTATPTTQSQATTEPSATSATSSTKATTTPPKVDRPADIDLTAVKPCDVTTALKPADFGIDQLLEPRASASDIFPGSQSCSAFGQKANLILSVEAVVTEGFTSYTTSVVGNLTPLKIEGYPAATLAAKDGRTCFTVVDTKDGQMMYFQFGVANSRSQPITPQPELCAKVSKIAEAGMKVVLAR